MIGYIYMTTNKINGKRYIGQHTADKFEPEKYIGSGNILLKAIQKYGKESFTCELIEECNSLQELNDREKYWIAYYNASHDPMFYNLTQGGIGGAGEYMSKRITERWKDTDYRNIHVRGVTAAWADPVHRAKHVAANRRVDHNAYWTKENREAHSKRQKKSWQNPELRLQNRKHQLQIWTDEKKETQRQANIGKKFMTDGNGNWTCVKPELAPKGYYVASWVKIIKDGEIKLHERSKPLPEGWEIHHPRRNRKVS